MGASDSFFFFFFFFLKGWQPLVIEWRQRAQRSMTTQEMGANSRRRRRAGAVAQNVGDVDKTIEGQSRRSTPPTMFRSGSRVCMEAMNVHAHVRRMAAKAGWAPGTRRAQVASRQNDGLP